MSMQQTQRHFPLGAHLIVKHFGYSHHGIYAGRGRVIHYSGFAHIFKKRPIEMTSIQRFARGKPIYTRNYNPLVTRRKRSFVVCARVCMKIITI
jgi:hypothetical protein